MVYAFGRWMRRSRAFVSGQTEWSVQLAGSIPLWLMWFTVCNEHTYVYTVRNKLIKETS